MRLFSLNYEKIIFVIIFFYLFCSTLIINFFFNSSSVNSFIVITEKELFSLYANILWKEGDYLSEEIEMQKLFSGDKFIYYYNFNDYKKVEKIQLNYSGNIPIKFYLGKKFSIFDQPLILLPIYPKDKMVFDISKDIFHFKMVLFFIFLLSYLIIFIFLLVFLKKDKMFKLCFYFLLFLITSSFVKIFLLDICIEKVFFLVSYILNIVIAIYLYFSTYKILEKYFNNFKRVMLSFLFSFIWLNINVISVKSLFVKTSRAIFIIKASFWSQEGRNIFYYRGEYGHLYEYGQFIKTITTNSKIVFPSLTRCFGNEHVIRYFIYPNIPVMVPKEYCFSEKKFLEFLYTNNVFPCYVVTIKEGMEIWGKYEEWPSFQITPTKKYTITNTNFGNIEYSLLYFEEVNR